MIDKEKEANLALLKDKETPSIGGTAASTIFMESIGQKPPFGRSAFNEWLRLTGRKDLPVERSEEDESRLEIGRLMEEPVAIRFQRRTKFSLCECPMVSHPKYPWATGHIDRIVVEKPADLEIKTAERITPEWSDPQSGEPNRVPLAYFLQPVWYVGIPRYRSFNCEGKSSTFPNDIIGPFEREVYIAAQFGYLPLRIYRWEANDPQIRQIYSLMFEACQRFWEEYVLKDEPPPMSQVDANAAKQWLRFKYPKNENDEVVAATPRAIEIAEAFKEAQRKAEEATAEVDRLNAELSALIGKNYGIQATAAGKTMRATWSTVRASIGTDWERVVRELDVPIPADLIIRCEKVIRQGYRRLNVTVKEDK